MDLDFQQVVAELVRALRGRRSQLALSRRLRFQTNVVYSWERKRRQPSTSQVLMLAQRVGADLPRAFGCLYPVKTPGWMGGDVDFTARDVIAAFLTDARGATPLVHLSELTGFSRFALARWISGSAEPRASEFLALVHHCTHRLVDFLEPLIAGKTLPSLQREYDRVHAARRVAETFPLSQVLLRCLELQSNTRRNEESSFAERIGISREEEREMLTLLEATGQIRKVGSRYELQGASPLNMRLHREAAPLHRAFWANLAKERAPGSPDGLCAYNVCGVSREGYDKLRKLQREYLQKARALIEKSEPVERVALLQVNLVALVDDDAHEV